jgi:hypothetical protein
MSFSLLYDAVQQHEGRLSTKWLRDEALAVSRITLIKEQWTGVLDTASMRSFYIEGPLGPPVPLEENQALIVLARSLDRKWRRFLYVKELMHIFDTLDELTDTPEKLDALLERFTDPRADATPQFRAENKALFRALSLYCSEERRLEYRRALSDREMSLDVIAAALGLPVTFARLLFRNDYLRIVEACA